MTQTAALPEGFKVKFGNVVITLPNGVEIVVAIDSTRKAVRISKHEPENWNHTIDITPAASNQIYVK